MDSSESISHSEIDPCHSDHGIDDQFSSLSLHQTIEIDSGDHNRAEEEEANHDKFDSEIHNNGSDVENGGAEERENDENGGENREEEERENGEEKRRRDVYPVRAEAEDCSFYLRTGMCKYGMNCKFNHPPPKKIQDTMAKGKDESLNNGGQADGNNSVTRDGGKVKDKDRSLERSGQVNCKYFDRPGGCKFGKACKFNHSRKFSVAPMAELNFMGLPIRMGERECPYYMRNGSCKFGANCRFNHPDPSTVGGSDSTMPGYGNGKAMSPQSAPQSTFAPWPSPAALNETPYVPLMFSPTHGVPSRPEWNAYQAPVYSPERSMNRPPVYVVNGPPFGNNPHTHTHHHHQQQKPFPVDEFPERPGQPECNFFLKTGDCKYRSACKYHHPKNRIVKSTPCALSDLGLPLRPGQGVCSYYSRYGICKYGPSCKYDHPVNYVHSAPPTMPGPDRSGALSEGMTQNEDVTVGSGN